MTDREWLLAERPQLPLTPAATAKAERALRRHVSPRRRHTLPVLALAAAAIAATVVAATRHPAPAPAPRPAPPSLRLVAQRLQHAPRPAGDATLVIRHQSYPGQGTIDAADLYTDDGRYFFARKQSGLAAEVKEHHDRADGLFAREIAAAREAADHDLAAAREHMMNAPLGHPVTPAPDRPTADNWVWENSLDALNAGAGQPRVRSGVLRLMTTIRNVTVKPSGDTLVLSNGMETLVIDSQDGTPIRFLGGDPAKPSATITYDVRRVKLADLAP